MTIENEEKSTKTLPVIISGITGGEQISDRDIGDMIVIDDITDTYNRFPGAGPALDRSAFAAFIKGFTEDLDITRRMEFIKAEIWKKEFGYSVIVKKGENIKALHPKTYQVGFIITEIDDLGNATKIEMLWKPTEKAEPVPTEFTKYNEASGEGFFWFRTFRGLLGVRGLSHLLTLVEPLRVQNALFLQYMKHGEWQSINHPVAKIKNLNETIYNRVKNDLRASQKEKMVIVDSESDFYYDGPMAGGSSWDPTAMLEYGDKVISRETGLLLSMLTGDPMGYLSASDVTAAQWFDSVRQYQEIILPEYLPVLRSLGFTEEVKFNDPYEPTLESKFAALLQARQSLEGIVDPQQVIDVMNKILGYQEDERLRLDPNYQERQQMEMESARNQTAQDSETRRENA